MLSIKNAQWKFWLSIRYKQKTSIPFYIRDLNKVKDLTWGADADGAARSEADATRSQMGSAGLVSPLFIPLKCPFIHREYWDLRMLCSAPSSDLVPINIHFFTLILKICFSFNLIYKNKIFEPSSGERLKL